MAKFYGVELEDMTRIIREVRVSRSFGISNTVHQWNYDEVTVLYELQCLKHAKGQSIRSAFNGSRL